MTNKPASTSVTDRAADDALASLSPTVDTFAERLKRKLREQEIQEGESHKLAEQRHALMLQALKIIRRAFQETSKISLGTRFSFTTKVCDSEGWPKIELLLNDVFAPGRIDYALHVTANDRSQGGWISIGQRTGENLMMISMAEPGSLERLPVMLKKTLRVFLDAVGNYVLNPVKPDELVTVQARPLETSHLDNSLTKEDLFSEDFAHRDNKVVEVEDEQAPLEIGSKPARR